MNNAACEKSGVRPWFTQYIVWFINGAGKKMYVRNWDGKFYTFTMDPLYARQYTNIATAEKRLADIRKKMEGVWKIC